MKGLLQDRECHLLFQPNFRPVSHICSLHGPWHWSTQTPTEMLEGQEAWGVNESKDATSYLVLTLKLRLNLVKYSNTKSSHVMSSCQVLPYLRDQLGGRRGQPPRAHPHLLLLRQHREQGEWQHRRGGAAPSWAARKSKRWSLGQRWMVGQGRVPVPRGRSLVQRQLDAKKRRKASKEVYERHRTGTSLLLRMSSLLLFSCKFGTTSQVRKETENWRYERFYMH